MLDGTMSDAETRNLLIEIADRGETVADIVGAVRAIRARMLTITPPPGAIDVAGTGGDGQHSLNVSTAVAIVVAACDVPMAKCGNRAASSLAGTADTLEALGLDIHRATERAEASLADLGIAFIFVQRQLPALGRLAPIRRAIGRKTIFNLLGPLSNPAGQTRWRKRELRPCNQPSRSQANRATRAPPTSTVSVNIAAGRTQSPRLP